MNVWALSFDDSENSDDPVLRVFDSRAVAHKAILRMAEGSFYPLVVAQLADQPGSFTLNYYDDDEGERLSISLFHVQVEQAEVVTTKGVL